MTPHEDSRADMVDVTLFVSSFNEENLVTKALDTAREAFGRFDYAYEVLIYDDCSSDRSVEAIRDYIRDNDLSATFKLVENRKNMGIGINYFRAAEAGRGEYFLVMHGDNAVPVEAFVSVLALKGMADIIIPYYDTRLFSKKYNCDHRPFVRRLLSVVYSSLVRTLSGHKIRYFNGLMLHRRTNVVKNKVHAFGLGFQAELMCKILQDPALSYLEVRQHNYDYGVKQTTAFRIKNVLSVFGSLGRILRSRLAEDR